MSIFGFIEINFLIQKQC